MDKKNIVNLGIINFNELSDEFIQEVSPDKFNADKLIDICKIEVYGSEGQTPHFHVISTTNKFECCPCIFKALYFNHGYKTDKLSRKQLKILDDWLRLPCSKFGGVLSNWEIIVRLWESCDNPLTNYNINSIQPDYTKMVNMRN